MDPASQLAANCPRCFGPFVSQGPEAHEDEPHVIVCMDGNFQHRRHKAASVPIIGHEVVKPELFIHPEAVSAMAQLTSQGMRKTQTGVKADGNGIIVSTLGQHKGFWV